MMIPRILYHQVLNRLKQFPAVALLGPRQIGKTTLAEQIALQHNSIYLDLESPSDRAKLQDPVLYLSAHEDKLVILDEIQRIPELFQILRGLVDQGRKKGKMAGRFLLLGSASIDLLKQSGESLAGRIAYLEMTPFNLMEVGLQKIDRLWVRGGFPDSFLALSEEASTLWRENFIYTYLERDIPTLGPRIPAETLRRLWIMLSHHQGTMLNVAQLARNLAIDGKTVARYLDVLVDLLLVRRLVPWHHNTSKRLVKSPKIYVRDSGITHALLGITHLEALLSHPVVGASFEGFIIENIVSLAPHRTLAYFYRSAAGAEIDLILQFQQGEIWAIEIKRTLSPKVEKGFYLGCEEVRPHRKILLYPGQESYKTTHDVEIMSVQDLLSSLHLLH